MTSVQNVEIILQFIINLLLTSRELLVGHESVDRFLHGNQYNDWILVEAMEMPS